MLLMIQLSRRKNINCVYHALACCISELTCYSKQHFESGCDTPVLSQVRKLRLCHVEPSAHSSKEASCRIPRMHDMLFWSLQHSKCLSAGPGVQLLTSCARRSTSMTLQKQHPYNQAFLGAVVLGSPLLVAWQHCPRSAPGRALCSGLGHFWRLSMTFP